MSDDDNELMGPRFCNAESLLWRALDRAATVEEGRIEAAYMRRPNILAYEPLAKVYMSSSWEVIYSPSPRNSHLPGPIKEHYFFVKLPGLNGANRVVYDGPRRLFGVGWCAPRDLSPRDAARSVMGYERPPALLFVWDSATADELREYEEDVYGRDGAAFRIVPVSSGGSYLPDRCRLHEDCLACPALGHECLMASRKEEGP